MFRLVTDTCEDRCADPSLGRDPYQSPEELIASEALAKKEAHAFRAATTTP